MLTIYNIRGTIVDWDSSREYSIRGFLTEEKANLAIEQLNQERDEFKIQASVIWDRNFQEDESMPNEEEVLKEIEFSRQNIMNVDKTFWKWDEENPFYFIEIIQVEDY